MCRYSAQRDERLTRYTSRVTVGPNRRIRADAQGILVSAARRRICTTLALQCAHCAARQTPDARPGCGTSSEGAVNMGLFERFSSKDVDTFAKSLAVEISKRYPPTLDQAKEKKISQNRISRVLEDAYGKAIEFKSEKNLGVYRKARLGNTFRWELTELGYSKPFVEMATEGLIIYITRKAGESKEAPKKSA